MYRRILALFAAVTAMASASAFTVDTLDIKSQKNLLPEPMRITVVTPDGLQEGQKAPAVFLLNGYGGDYRSWHVIRKDLGDLADRYGMVFVTPSGMDSWYWDSPVDPQMQMESFFVEELVPYVRSNYPVSADPALNAITGLSMGGHGSIWLAMRHPDIWGNMGSTSGGVDIRPFEAKWKMAKRLGKKSDNPDVWETHTVTNHTDLIGKNGQNLIFDCGSEDFFAGVNAELHRKLLEAKIPHDYISRPGVHNAAYWGNSILYQLLYFDRCFSKAAK